ncbi:MAG TPA: PqqD family protein [Gemmatimonadales bacterium]|nr:PqqD family protein [Gemmatimonadales bacterium]
MSAPRVAKNVYAAQLAGEAVILHLDTKRYYRLNATGAEVWKGIEAGEDREALARRLVREFTVEEETAAAEVDRLLDRLREARLVE